MFYEAQIVAVVVGNVLKFLLGIIGNMFRGYNFTANQYDLTCPRLLLRTLELITQNYFPGYFLYHYGQNKEGNN